MVRTFTYTADNTEAREKMTSKMVTFAHAMKQIPRKVAHCEVYNTVHVVVDTVRVLNIFKKVFGTADKTTAYEALNVLQTRLDEIHAS
jgi:hypothetical protein